MDEPEDITLNEISQKKKDNLHLQEVPRVVRFIDRESSMMVARGWGRRTSWCSWTWTFALGRCG